MGGSRCTQLSTYVAGRSRQILQGLAPVKPVCPRPLAVAMLSAGPWIAIASQFPRGFPTQCWERNCAPGTSKGYPVIRQMADELAHHESHAVDSIHHNDIPPTHTTMFQQQGTRAPQHPYERRFSIGGLNTNALHI